MDIGAKIRTLRKEKKVTQEALADYLRISPQAISKWETGVSSPDIDLLPKLAIFFGTSVDHLLDFDQSRIDSAVEALVAECGRRSEGDPIKAEAFLRKALEKYPNNDLLLTCLLESLQRQNAGRARSAEIIETGERILACTKDDDLKIDVLRILAETYHSMGEQAMAEHYLHRIPRLDFWYFEIAAAIKEGRARMDEIEAVEELSIEKLLRVLWMRLEEETDGEKRAALNRQAHELLEHFRGYPMYREIAEEMQRHWNKGTIMDIYQ